MRLAPIALILVAVMITYGLGLSIGNNVISPHVTFGGVMLTNGAGKGGMFIAPLEFPNRNLEKTNNGLVYSSHTNITGLNHFKVNIDQSILMPNSISSLQVSPYISPPFIKNPEKHALVYKVQYYGNSSFKYLEIIENMEGSQYLWVNQQDNFTYGNFIGALSYNISGNSGGQYCNIYLPGTVGVNQFVQVYLFRHLDYWKIFILIPISNTRELTFSQLEITSYNMSLVETAVPANGGNIYYYSFLGLLIGVVIVTGLIYYYRKKE